MKYKGIWDNYRPEPTTEEERGQKRYKYEIEKA